MKNPFVRWTVIVLGGFAVMAAIAAAVLYFLISRFDARAEIARAVRDVTGRELTIAGEVGVRLFPVLGLTAREASLANVEGGRAPALASMQAISIGVEIWPLLARQQIDVRSLILDRPVIALETDAAGAPNWILTPTAAAPSQAPGQPPPAFSLAEVVVTGGEVSFYDGASQTGWVIADADLRTALLGLEQPMRITGDAAYKDSEIDLDLTIDEPGKAFAGAATGITVSIRSDLLEASFVGQTTAASAELNGDVRARGDSLKELAAWAGAPVADLPGLGQFAVQGRLTIAGGQLRFANASIVVDRLRGRGDFTILAARARPYVSGRLELFDLDLNPYLTGAPADVGEGDPEADLAAIEQGAEPAMAEIAAAPAAPRALDIEVAPSETPIDFSALKAINADLELTTGALRMQAMSIDGAQITLVLNDGFLAATLHRLDLYGGTGRGRLMVDAREPMVKIDEDLTITGVNARAFLTDAANLDNLEGEAEITLGFRTQGATQSQFISALDGRGHIEVTSGALRGVDLGGVSRTIRNAMRGELVGPDKRTPFNGFSATFSAADGVLASDTLSFNTPDLRITGLALIDLGGRRLDVRLAPRSPRGGLVFPFTVRGQFDQPFAYNSDLTGRVLEELRPRVEAVKRGSRER